jgi:hypothetical protein
MWSYTCDAGEYYDTSLLGLCWTILSDRYWRWWRGEGRVD